MIGDRLLKSLFEMSFISSSIFRILARIDCRAELITYMYASGTYIPQDDYEAYKPKFLRQCVLRWMNNLLAVIET